jgi:hypothetical protein
MLRGRAASSALILRSIATRCVSKDEAIDIEIAPARSQQKGPRFARGPSSGVVFGCYFSPSAAGAAPPFLEPELMPVVVPDFALLVFILSDFILPDFMLGAPGPALPSLDAPAAGCVCADAIAVAPNNDAIMRAEIASLDRMNNLLLWMCDAGVELATRICVPGSAVVFLGGGLP